MTREYRCPGKRGRLPCGLNSAAQASPFMICVRFLFKDAVYSFAAQRHAKALDL